MPTYKIDVASVSWGRLIFIASYNKGNLIFSCCLRYQKSVNDRLLQCNMGCRLTVILVIAEHKSVYDGKTCLYVLLTKSFFFYTA